MTAYLDLADFVAITAEVTGVDEVTIISAANLNLADSALNAPASAFRGEECCPDFVDKCAVFPARLAKNHPLPDGNKRLCWVSLRLFIELNGWDWTSRPSVDEAERIVLSVASGEHDEEGLAAWLHDRTGPRCRPRARWSRMKNRFFGRVSCKCTAALTPGMRAPTMSTSSGAGSGMGPEARSCYGLRRSSI